MADLKADSTTPHRTDAPPRTKPRAAWLHWRARPVPVIAMVAVTIVGVHAAITYLRTSAFFSDFQAAGPVAIGAGLIALAMAHVDEPTGLAELHSRAARSPLALYIGPRIAVFTLAAVGLTTAVRDVPTCGPLMAFTDLSLFTGTTLLLTAAVGRAIGGALPVVWTVTLAVSSSATGTAAVLWRTPLDCTPPEFVTFAGVLTTAVGIALPPRRSW